MLPEEGGVPSAALDCVPVLAGGRRGVQLCSSCERCVHAPAGLPRIFSYPSHGRTLKTRAGSLYQHTVIRKELKTAVKIHNIKLTIKCFKVALSCNCHHLPRFPSFQTETPGPWVLPHSLLHSVSGNHYSTFCLCAFDHSSPSCRWSHPIFVLLCLAYFT